MAYIEANLTGNNVVISFLIWLYSHGGVAHDNTAHQ